MPLVSAVDTRVGPSLLVTQLYRTFSQHDAAALDAALPFREGACPLRMCQRCRRDFEACRTVHGRNHYGTPFLLRATRELQWWPLGNCDIVNTQSHTGPYDDAMLLLQRCRRSCDVFFILKFPMEHPVSHMLLMCKNSEEPMPFTIRTTIPRAVTSMWCTKMEEGAGDTTADTPREEAFSAHGRMNMTHEGCTVSDAPAVLVGNAFFVTHRYTRLSRSVYFRALEPLLLQSTGNILEEPIVRSPFLQRRHWYEEDQTAERQALALTCALPVRAHWTLWGRLTREFHATRMRQLISFHSGMLSSDVPVSVFFGTRIPPGHQSRAGTLTPWRPIHPHSEEAARYAWRASFARAFAADTIVRRAAALGYRSVHSMLAVASMSGVPRDVTLVPVKEDPSPLWRDISDARHEAFPWRNELVRAAEDATFVSVVWDAPLPHHWFVRAFMEYLLATAAMPQTRGTGVEEEGEQRHDGTTLWIVPDEWHTVIKRVIFELYNTDRLHGTRLELRSGYPEVIPDPEAPEKITLEIVGSFAYDILMHSQSTLARSERVVLHTSRCPHNLSTAILPLGAPVVHVIDDAEKLQHPSTLLHGGRAETYTAQVRCMWQFATWISLPGMRCAPSPKRVVLRRVPHTLATWLSQLSAPVLPSDADTYFDGLEHYILHTVLMESSQASGDEATHARDVLFNLMETWSSSRAQAILPLPICFHPEDARQEQDGTARRAVMRRSIFAGHVAAAAHRDMVRALQRMGHLFGGGGSDGGGLTPLPLHRVCGGVPAGHVLNLLPSCMLSQQGVDAYGLEEGGRVLQRGVAVRVRIAPPVFEIQSVCTVDKKAFEPMELLPGGVRQCHPISPRGLACSVQLAQWRRYRMQRFIRNWTHALHADTSAARRQWEKRGAAGTLNVTRSRSTGSGTGTAAASGAGDEEEVCMLCMDRPGGQEIPCGHRSCAVCSMQHAMYHAGMNLRDAWTNGTSMSTKRAWNFKSRLAHLQRDSTVSSALSSVILNHISSSYDADWREASRRHIDTIIEAAQQCSPSTAPSSSSSDAPENLSYHADIQSDISFQFRRARYDTHLQCWQCRSKYAIPPQISEAFRGGQGAVNPLIASVGRAILRSTARQHGASVVIQNPLHARASPSSIHTLILATQSMANRIAPRAGSLCASLETFRAALSDCLPTLRRIILTHAVQPALSRTLTTVVPKAVNILQFVWKEDVPET